MGSKPDPPFRRMCFWKGRFAQPAFPDAHRVVPVSPYNLVTHTVMFPIQIFLFYHVSPDVHGKVHSTVSLHAIIGIIAGQARSPGATFEEYFGGNTDEVVTAQFKEFTTT